MIELTHGISNADGDERNLILEYVSKAAFERSPDHWDALSAFRDAAIAGEYDSKARTGGDVRGEIH